MTDTVRMNGAAVELRRKQHPKFSRQKTLAPALGISSRTLRNIERLNKVRTVGFAKRMAATLGCELSDIVFSTTGPTLVPAPPPSPQLLTPGIRRFEGKQLYPRFDTQSASVTSTADLFESAHRAELVLAQYQMELSPELTGYAEELIALTREASRESHPYFMEENDPRGPEIQERMRWLLIQLKGNDVLVYVCDHTKYLPESDEMVDRKIREYQWQAIIAFAPPQEYGETSVDVDVDHGQPYIIDWDAPLAFPKPAPGGS
jgi:DNA-binding XRE family transcriptional regulator